MKKCLVLALCIISCRVLAMEIADNGWAEAKALGFSYSQMVELLEINCEGAFRFIGGTLDED